MLQLLARGCGCHRGAGNVEPNALSSGLNFQIVDGDARVLCAICAPGERAHAREQFFKGERFDQVIVCEARVSSEKYSNCLLTAL